MRRCKSQVEQALRQATTTEEKGAWLIRQMWTSIQNLKQATYQTDFEKTLDNWNDYRPSIISLNCVKILFESNNYTDMFQYLESPENYIKEWLKIHFNDKYEKELQQYIQRLKNELDAEKKKLDSFVKKREFEHRNAGGSFTTMNLLKSLCAYLKERDDSDSSDHLFDELIIDNKMDIDILLTAIISTATNKLKSYDEPFLQLGKELMERNKETLFDRFYLRSKGCGLTCPYCKQHCDNDDPQHVKHRCDYHLLWAFSGYRDRHTGVPSIITCSSNEAFERAIRYHGSNSVKYIVFPEHIARFNPSWNITNLKSPLQDYLVRAYIALEEDLVEKHKFPTRVPQEVRKAHYRATVTPHCYALLVGIDYTNTQNALGTIPSNNVAMLKKQLKKSSTAYDENLLTLINEAATKEAILQKLQGIISRLDSRSTFIFFFNGHGGRTNNQSSLYCVDNQHLTSQELADVLLPSKSNRILILLDCCFSGAISSPFNDSRQFEPGIHLLCSSQPNQVSYAFLNEETSFFTKHLLNGLKGKFQCRQNNCNECQTRRDNLKSSFIRKISCSELINYLSHSVTDIQHFSHSAINGKDFDISFLD
jgi:hypothetical protein